MTPLEQAAKYAESVGPLFPCRERGPGPGAHTPRGFYDASRDPWVIQKWFEFRPEALIGMPTGPASGFVVFDIDVKRPEANGFDSLEDPGSCCQRPRWFTPRPAAFTLISKIPTGNCETVKARSGRVSTSVGPAATSSCRRLAAGIAGVPFTTLTQSKLRQHRITSGRRCHPGHRCRQLRSPRATSAVMPRRRSRQHATRSFAQGRGSKSARSMPSVSQSELLSVLASCRVTLRCTHYCVPRAACRTTTPHGLGAGRRSTSRSAAVLAPARPTLARCSVSEWLSDEERAALRGSGGAPDHVVKLEIADARPPEYSDEAMALRFSDKHADGARYVAAWGRWLLWTGSRWQFDVTMRAFDLAKIICRVASAEITDPKMIKLAAGVASAKTVAATVQPRARRPPPRRHGRAMGYRPWTTKYSRRYHRSSRPAR